MSKVIDLESAVRLIKDGDTITWVGCVGALSPEAVLGAIEAIFLSEGHPRGLTCFESCSTVTREHFGYEGLMKRLITTYLGNEQTPDICKLVADNKIEAYTIPLGVSNQLMAEIARKSPGLLTKVGLHSYLDPRLQGGKYNNATTGELIKLVKFEGEDWLLYKTFPINIAVIRATTADEDGNLSLEQETLTGSVLYEAMAAKNWGGKVIAQVRRVVPKGSIDPRMVLVPGVMVDAIVVAEDQWQCERLPGQYDAGLDGRERIPPPPGPVHPLSAEKIIARRAALELKAGQVVNFGGGIPTRRLAPVTLEEDIQDLFHVSREHGVLGGISYGRDVHINPTSWLSYQDLFNWYSGGGLDLQLLGFGQLDEEGNVNSSILAEGSFRGPGGAPDLAHNAKSVVFTGTFTQGGLDVTAHGGKLSIVKEGRRAKLLNKVYHVTMSGRHMREQGKPVLFVTERAVFKLTQSGLELTEIAPGVDLEKDVLGHMEFKPAISNSLRKMDSRIFTDGLMGLRRDILGYEEVGRRPTVPMVPVNELPLRAYWTSYSKKL